jgi:hypothetical protein
MKSFGKLVYSPRTHLASGKNWVVLMADDEISKYYRHLYDLQYPYKNGEYTGHITRPVWGAHISLLRSETPKNMEFWKKDDSKIIEFEYEPEVQDNGEYFWLKVKCDYLLDLREKLGLRRHPKFGLHLTIGRRSY